MAEDFGFKPHLRNGAEAIFKEHEGKDDFIPYESKDWKGTLDVSYLHSLRSSVNVGCAHGFAIRPNQSVPDVKAGYEGALIQSVEWFKGTLF